MAKKSTGFDSHKRWGNSATRGHGVNSPAMMEARKGFAKSKALKKKSKGISLKTQQYHDNLRTKGIADHWMKKLKQGD